MKRTLSFAIAAAMLEFTVTAATQPLVKPLHRSAAPVLEWSNEARRAIVPPGPNGIFGAENYGSKFPGEAAVYMGLVHAAMHDAAIALDRPARRGGEAHADAPSPSAAIARAAYRMLIGLQPALGLTPAQQAGLDARYDAYLARIAGDGSIAAGTEIGERAAWTLLAQRANDGRDSNPVLGDLNSPPSGPGVWEPGPAPALGLRLPGMRPLVMSTASQFRPNGPAALSSPRYADDFAEVAALGRANGSARTAEQEGIARFWTDHDLRQWNDALLRLATVRGLDLRGAARLLAMAHVAGGDAMIACFDAKYAYWFWRPAQAIPAAAADGNDATVADSAWQPMAATPGFPEYPSAHSCHSAALTEALSAFFGTDRIHLTIDSRVTGATRSYARFRDVVREVESARVLAGFHFRHSDEDGSRLGRQVARYVIARGFAQEPAGMSGAR